MILKSNFDTVDLLSTIEANGVTVSFAVPAMLQALSEDPRFHEADLSSLRLMIAGGASVPASLLNRYESRGIQVSQGWGMTETATTVTFLAPRQASAKIGSCGTAAMLSEFRLVDFSGKSYHRSRYQRRDLRARHKRYEGILESAPGHRGIVR